MPVLSSFESELTEACVTLISSLTERLVQHRGVKKVCVCLVQHRGVKKVCVCLVQHRGVKKVCVCLVQHCGVKKVCVCLVQHCGVKKACVCLVQHCGVKKACVCLVQHWDVEDICVCPLPLNCHMGKFIGVGRSFNPVIPVHSRWIVPVNNIWSGVEPPRYCKPLANILPFHLPSHSEWSAEHPVPDLHPVSHSPAVPTCSGANDQTSNGLYPHTEWSFGRFEC